MDRIKLQAAVTHLEQMLAQGIQGKLLDEPRLAVMNCLDRVEHNKTLK